MRVAPDRAYALPALLFLAVTVWIGVWLRGILLVPALAAGFPFRFIVHAHSHLAFFGWVTMLLFGCIVRPFGSQATSFFRLHALALALASAAAFAAFLTGGYGAAGIATSVLHVALWIAFIVRAWPLTTEPFQRSALAYLGMAGAATFAPLLVLLRGASDAWWSELAVKLFLIPFINGWVTLGVLGAVAGRVGYRGGRAARILIAAGALPSTLLFIAAPPPSVWLPGVGRAGAGLVALGSVMAAVSLLRCVVSSTWLRIGLVALLLKGGIELLAAVGVGGALMRSPPIVLAHLHLVLLGFVTASLIGTVVGTRARLAAIVFGAGTALMLAALVTSGWARIFLVVARVGLDSGALLWIALAGGALAALGASAAATRAIGGGSTDGEADPGDDVRVVRRPAPVHHAGERAARARP